MRWNYFEKFKIASNLRHTDESFAQQLILVYVLQLRLETFFSQYLIYTVSNNTCMKDKSRALRNKTIIERPLIYSGMIYM